MNLILFSTLYTSLHVCVVLLHPGLSSLRIGSRSSWTPVSSSSISCSSFCSSEGARPCCWVCSHACSWLCCLGYSTLSTAFRGHFVVPRAASSHAAPRGAACGPLAASPAPLSPSTRGPWFQSCGRRSWLVACHSRSVLGEGKTEAAIVLRGPLRHQKCSRVKAVESPRLSKGLVRALSHGSCLGHLSTQDTGRRVQRCLAVPLQARPAPSPRPPHETVRRRGLVARSEPLLVQDPVLISVIVQSAFGHVHSSTSKNKSCKADSFGD